MVSAGIHEKRSGLVWCIESPRTTGKHDESAFQRAVIDERKRRRLLATLQYELAPKFGLGRERGNSRFQLS